jgi:hypothetical protein
LGSAGPKSVDGVTVTSVEMGVTLSNSLSQYFFFNNQRTKKMLRLFSDLDPWRLHLLFWLEE